MQTRFLLPFLLATLLLQGCTVFYMLEPDVEQYSDYFPVKQGAELDFGEGKITFRRSGRETSAIFPNPDSRTWINIEHGVPLNDYDVKMLPEMDTRHFVFSAVVFHEQLDIAAVEVSHEYRGFKLRKAGTFIYRYDGAIEYGEDPIVTRYEGGPLPKNEYFIFVTIYRRPPLKSRFTWPSEKNWFTAPVKESILIKYVEDDTIKEKEYHLDLQWKRYEAWIT